MAASAFLAWEGFEKDRYRYLILAGVTSTLAYLTKAEGLFVIIIIFSYIWIRDFKIRKYNFRKRILNSLSFLLLPLAVGIPFIAAVTIKTGSFTISYSKPLDVLFGREHIIQDQKHSLKVLERTTGFGTLDRFIDFLLYFVRSIFEPFIVLLLMNVTRFWTGKKISEAGRYLLFFILSHLGLVFVYYDIIHRLTDRWFLFPIALLILPMGYGMGILIDLLKRLNNRVKRLTLIKVGDTLIVLLIFGLIVINISKGFRNTRYHWLTLKISGEYILEHYGPGKSFLCDDCRLAYYSDGVQTELEELDLDGLVAKFEGDGCPYDFVALCNTYNFALIEEYPEIFDLKKYEPLEIPYPDGMRDIYLFKCADLDKLK
jgi:4-amino-4-deoxy-L-arabinose transferase-like glycosyltransferase